MSAINFPNSPVLNEVFSASGKSWRWDGTVWVVVPPDEWQRPALWLPMPEIDPTEEKFAGLMAVFDHDSNFCALMVDGTGGSSDDYEVDWGDGTVETFDFGVAATHLYDYDDAGLTDTSSELGYRQAMVVVSSEGGGRVWTTFSLQQDAALPDVDSVGWLDMALSGPGLTAIDTGVPY
jgi:hypothetical protein